MAAENLGTAIEVGNEGRGIVTRMLSDSSERCPDAFQMPWTKPES